LSGLRLHLTLRRHFTAPTSLKRVINSPLLCTHPPSRTLPQNNTFGFSFAHSHCSTTHTTTINRSNNDRLVTSSCPDGQRNYGACGVVECLETPTTPVRISSGRQKKIASGLMEAAGLRALTRGKRIRRCRWQVRRAQFCARRGAATRHGREIRQSRRDRSPRTTKRAPAADRRICESGQVQGPHGRG
jgi:hypothetical protein